MKFESAANSLAQCGRGFYDRGWVPGTSGNFSAKLSDDPFRICITASGNDKGELSSEHFLEADERGEVVAGNGKPSAETQIHTTIYKNRQDAGSVLHTHSVWGTVLSDLQFEKGAIEIEGYEMLKGLAGIKTHNHSEKVPVIANSQDYDSLAKGIDAILLDHPSAHGFYLRRHGLYTWGRDIDEAKRHIEIFEFLFEVMGRGRMLSR